MTNPRLIAIWAAPAAAFALLVVLVASRAPLWTSWPGTAVRFGGFLLVAAALYAMAGRWERRTSSR